ncbi:kinase-like domain-containing protein [Globomyces pollinis-pini]|nr:kinase-like domain-containing protein [Globomyces pollinis-pini]
MESTKLSNFSTFKSLKDSNRLLLHNQYETLGFISSGTYGNVFKAKKIKSKKNIQNLNQYAIKKFKPDKEGEAALSSGISQSACREIGLCRELIHVNVIFLEQVILDPKDRSIAMIFDYAEHDLLQILHFHSQQERKSMPEYTVKSFLWQLLNGVAFLHSNWVLHRDLKPANIMVSSSGVVKIGKLGLARLFQEPLHTLYYGDKVVVTIWYRSPELLLGSRHYTKGIDIWAIGCIFAELLLLKPLFKGEEAKMDKKTIPFQKDQMAKIIDILGFPNKDRWPGIEFTSEYSKLQEFDQSKSFNLKATHSRNVTSKSEHGYNLLAQMLEYNPDTRISADVALKHPYFSERPVPGQK